MTIRQLFPTLLYQEAIDPALVAELDHSCRALSEEDGAGRRWSRDHGYRGYTSYASLNDLPRRDPVFDDLRRQLDRHVARFAEAAAFDLGGRRLKLDSLWVNVLRAGGHHGAHIHPHSVVSGTVYVAVPPGAGGLKLEDPRLPMLMAAPTRRADAPDGMRTFETVQPEAGTLLLWESWLRHEVVPHTGKSGAGGERISVSFNYR
ncbi:2OG-Fe(II) oxygenase-related protein [Sphingomonas metalli]|uniref:2OG-Fe(II) oxygenase-related protein n=1 Tax=Sphingomonas metalli TaxID=1779358 RepID=A0A916WWZ1_9SPHN|nr:TIGR02466 family protein [Sphingomonas metalli]GGB36431.1 2OG-Fe(II) oxygenase-related protein [Sphingomonas metalli]